MKGIFLLYTLFLLHYVSAQQSGINPVRDAFLSIATDARAAGQGDIGVATATDVFSQLWNPSKYVFSAKKIEVGIIQIFTSSQDFDEFSQLNFNFYNKLNDRSAYALSIRSYANSVGSFVETGIVNRANELSIGGSYTMKLSNEFAMAVGGRYISLNEKAPMLDGFNTNSSLYGIDVSGFYQGNEIAYKAFNGRWRAGFNFSNLRGKSFEDKKHIEIYAPSTLKIGLGFDFIFNQDKRLAVTSEYKTLLDSYTENEAGEPLEFVLEGSAMGAGLEFTFREKLVLRTGYSIGINRATDTFATLGTGFKGRFVDLDVAILLGVSDAENLIRQKLRLSLGLNLDEVF
ncbi:PorV/PorQ family protein [Maribacter sp. 2210JD10-5]|uniref:PorV/PorQ family protein n=1 Tax=Maribacter sp. 2210JD10-5 TaxID=3386272 RepID=UPI0039BCD6DD